MQSEQNAIREYEELPAEEKQAIADIARAWRLDVTKMLEQETNHCNSYRRLVIRDGHVRDLNIDTTYYVFHPDWPLQPDESGNLKADNIEILSNAPLYELPPSIGDLRFLEVLHVRDNKCTSLPPALTKLSELRELDLSWNRLTVLGEPITSLRKLRVLLLGSNPITSISPDIGKLVDLEELNFSDIYKREAPLAFPESLGDLHKLRKLKIQNIPDLVLPSSFTKLQQLEELELIHCAVKQPKELVAMVRSLKHLRKIEVMFCNFGVPILEPPGK